jgi:hypothetical protein
MRGYTLDENGQCFRCNARREARAEDAAVLQDILSAHIRDTEPWRGCDFGKAHVGNAIIGAILDCGGVPRFT